jgi:hypothetical protein
LARGRLGWVSRGELLPEIDKVVFALPVNAVSDPIPTKFGWHLVKVLEKSPVSYKPFSEVRAEILKREQETQFQKKLAEYIEKLKRDAVIRVAPDMAGYYTPPPPAPATTISALAPAAAPGATPYDVPAVAPGAQEGHRDRDHADGRLPLRRHDVTALELLHREDRGPRLDELGRRRGIPDLRQAEPGAALEPPGHGAPGQVHGRRDQ